MKQGGVDGVRLFAFSPVANAGLKTTIIGLVHQDGILIRSGSVTANDHDMTLLVDDAETSSIRLNPVSRLVIIFHTGKLAQPRRPTGASATEQELLGRRQPETKRGRPAWSLPNPKSW